jgi:hypothetical protein
MLQTAQEGTRWQGQEGGALALKALGGCLPGGLVDPLFALVLVDLDRFAQMLPIPKDAAGKQSGFEMVEGVLDFSFGLGMDGSRSDGLDAVVATEGEEAGGPVDDVGVGVPWTWRCQ